MMFAVQPAAVTVGAVYNSIVMEHTSFAALWQVTMHPMLPVVLLADVVMHVQQGCWVVRVELAICAMLCPGRCASWHTHQRANVTQQSVAMGLQVTCTCHTHTLVGSRATLKKAARMLVPHST
jgi:hypothetical protein